MKFFLATVFILCGVLHLSAGAAISKHPIADSVDAAISSPYVPAAMKQVLASAKTVYEKYLKDAGESKDNSDKAIERIVESAVASGLSLDSVKALFTNGMDYALKNPNVSESTKKTLTAGKSAYEKYFDSTGSSRITQDDVRSVVNDGAEYAMAHPDVSTKSKAVIAAGLALQEAWKKYRETGDVTQAGASALNSGLNRLNEDLTKAPGKNTRGVKSTGGSLAQAAIDASNDLDHGKDFKNVFAKRTQQAIETITKPVKKEVDHESFDDRMFNDMW